jgi:hypothetical protein
VQAGADGVAVVVGQADAGDEAVAGAHGVCDEVRRDIGEAELGAEAAGIWNRTARARISCRESPSIARRAGAMAPGGRVLA